MLSFNRSYFSWAVAVHILSLNQGYENLANNKIFDAFRLTGVTEDWLHILSLNQGYAK
jgi:hypothetical protein